MKMKMKAILAGLVGMVVASSAHAATLTYVLSLNDNGTGTPTANSYAVYAFTSAGDNAGLVSFTITTTGQTTTLNRAPQATFAADDEVSDAKTSGFTLLRSAGSSGVATTGAFDTVSGNGVPVYGVGQTTGSVRTVAPVGYTATSTVAQGAFGVTNSFTVNPIVNGTFTGSGGQVPVLVASGTGLPTGIALGAGNLLTGNGFTAVAPTSILQQQRNLIIPEPASLAAIGLVGAGVLARRRKA